MGGSPDGHELGQRGTQLAATALDEVIYVRRDTETQRFIVIREKRCVSTYKNLAKLFGRNIWLRKLWF